MSADNGFIIRKNEDGKFVLQEYGASADDYPSINHPRAEVFDTLEEAVLKYEKIDEQSWYPIEYNLTVRVQNTTLPKA